MKYSKLTFSLLLFHSFNTFSQDVATLKNCDDIQSKVSKIAEEDVKFIKLSYLPCPIDASNKSEIFMIKYKNSEKNILNDSDTNNSKNSQVEYDKYLKIDFGSLWNKYYEGEKKITKHEFVSIIKSHPAAYRQYKQGKGLSVTSDIIGLPSGIVLGSNLGTWVRSGNQQNYIILVVSGICAGGSMILKYVGREKIRKAIDTYNSSKYPAS